ncbi:MAG: TetR/AcrR family transcriptional regulator [Anaerolineae bacterium]|nr:TetR/AcrR family transcriptional regulator [Anaerolineae bacterium]
MTKTQKQIQSEQTRQQIIQAAAELFTCKGYAGTSISDLANAVGLTKGALYHHFENKDALFLAVVEALRENWGREVGRVVARTKGALNRIAAMFELHARLIQKNNTYCLLMLGLFSNACGEEAKFSGELEAVYGELARFVQAIIEKGQAEGEIRADLDTRLMALNIVAMMRGNCISLISGVALDEYTGLMDTMKEMAISSLQP